MAFVPDEFAKTIAIPVRIVSGRIEFFYGGPLPSLEGEVIGDLVVPAFAVTDPEIYLGMEAEGGTIDGSAYRRDGLRPKLSDGSCRYSVLVPVQLDEPLRLTLRGTKRPVLGPCRCTMPKLQLTATSINQMYSLISTRLEPKRRSHVGNVFRTAYVLKDKRWLSLDDLRGGYEAKMDLYFTFASLWNTLVVTARATAPTPHSRLRLVKATPRHGDDAEVLRDLFAQMRDLSDILHAWATSQRQHPVRQPQLPLLDPNGDSQPPDAAATVGELAAFRKYLAARADDPKLASETARLLSTLRTHYVLGVTLMDAKALHVLETVNPLLRELCNRLSPAERSGKEEQ
ncbi:MAG: hypothetical protein HYU88_01345 [Chloroflexi bacterium]|nr:hypothetical protein [Chloroflexota bacterium]